MAYVRCRASTELADSRRLARSGVHRMAAINFGEGGRDNCTCRWQGSLRLFETYARHVGGSVTFPGQGVRGECQPPVVAVRLARSSLPPDPLYPCE